MTEVSDEINELPAVYKALASFPAGALQSRAGKIDRRTQGEEDSGVAGVQSGPAGAPGTREPGILTYYLSGTRSAYHPALNVLNGRFGEDSQGGGDTSRVGEAGKIGLETPTPA